MPKETFYRLPDEKRERIMAAAEREFLENSFEAASINRIIKVSVFPPKYPAIIPKTIPMAADSNAEEKPRSKEYLPP